MPELLGFCKAYKRGHKLHPIYNQQRASFCGRFVGRRRDVPRECRHCGGFIPVNPFGGHDEPSR